MKHRQVKHFGFEFNYSTNDIDPDDPLEEKVPPECLKVAEKAVTEGLMDVVADQMTVNRYLPGKTKKLIYTYVKFGLIENV